MGAAWRKAPSAGALFGRGAAIDARRLASCEGKERYTHAGAVQAVERRERSGRVAGGKVGRGQTAAYQCDHCGHWHVGTRNMRK